MLEMRNLSVEVEGKPILTGINLDVGKGQVGVIFGPNGSGKSTLIKTVMGFSGYVVTAGEIMFKGTLLNGLSVDQRVKQGIGMMYQHPPTIRGVKLSQVARFLSSDTAAIERAGERLSLQKLLPREINLGFSGGEMKRSELFQLVLQGPDLVLLDEPESGVDLENIAIMGTVLRDFLKEGKSALIITHTGYILDYVPAEKGCVMIEGNLWCVGNPREMLADIRQHGYDRCRACREPSVVQRKQGGV